MDHKPLPIGTDDFKKLISEGYYYVDKTLFIKELLDKKGEANLFTRPRRFGKTLNMSMLRYFFENTGNKNANAENRELFDGLAIMSEGDKYLSHMQKYPVVSLSLKGAKQPTWELAYTMLIHQIAEEFIRHHQVLDKLSPFDQERFSQIEQQGGDMSLYIDALAFLSKCLHEAYGQKVIILIDEYDVPLENAHFRGFYQQMIDFIRSLFESALKTNPHLYFAVITGCLRITKESIFTGLNNLKINSIMDASYGEFFGFTTCDVKKLLCDHGKSDTFAQVKEWYDGYLFGDSEIYNPWSVLNFLANSDGLQRAYWSNTSSNDIVRTLVEKADLSVRAEIEELIAGGMIEKPVHEDITYQDIYSSDDNLWNFLFFTGYLRSNERKMINDQIYVTLSIPNKEVCQIYKTKVMGWFKDKVEQKALSSLYHAILEGDIDVFQEQLTEILQDSISFYDNVEAFYHGFMEGILVNMKNRIVKSNRESGKGRYDILIRSVDIRKPIVLMEFKIAKDYPSLEKRAQEALDQIAEKEYDREFKMDGYQNSIRYGVAFYKKSCCIKKEEVVL